MLSVVLISVGIINVHNIVVDLVAWHVTIMHGNYYKLMQWHMIDYNLVHVLNKLQSKCLKELKDIVLDLGTFYLTILAFTFFFHQISINNLILFFYKQAWLYQDTQ
jgi:hypothetical protein